MKNQFRSEPRLRAATQALIMVYLALLFVCYKKDLVSETLTTNEVARTRISGTSSASVTKAYPVVELNGVKRSK